MVLSLLNDVKDSLSAESYQKYMEAATSIFEEDQDAYLRKLLRQVMQDFRVIRCFMEILVSLDKVVDVIRYFAALQSYKSLQSSVDEAYGMQMRWLIKEEDAAITGLVYRALPMEQFL